MFIIPPLPVYNRASLPSFIFIILINLKINYTLQTLIQCEEKIQSYLAAVMVALILIKDG